MATKKKSARKKTARKSEPELVDVELEVDDTPPAFKWDGRHNTPESRLKAINKQAVEVEKRRRNLEESKEVLKQDRQAFNAAVDKLQAMADQAPQGTLWSE